MGRMRTISVPAEVYRSVSPLGYDYKRLVKIVEHASTLDWELWSAHVLTTLTDEQKAEAEALCKQRDRVDEHHTEAVNHDWEHGAEVRACASIMQTATTKLAELDAAEQSTLEALRRALCSCHERGVTGESLEQWLRQNVMLDHLVKTMAANTEQRSALMGELEQATVKREAAEKAEKESEANVASLAALLTRSKDELKQMLGHAEAHAKVELGIAEACVKHGLTRARCEELIKHAAHYRLSIK